METKTSGRSSAPGKIDGVWGSGGGNNNSLLAYRWFYSVWYHVWCFYVDFFLQLVSDIYYLYNAKSMYMHICYSFPWIISVLYAISFIYYDSINLLICSYITVSLVTDNKKNIHTFPNHMKCNYLFIIYYLLCNYLFIQTANNCEPDSLRVLKPRSQTHTQIIQHELCMAHCVSFICRAWVTGNATVEHNTRVHWAEKRHLHSGCIRVYFFVVVESAHYTLEHGGRWGGG